MMDTDTLPKWMRRWLYGAAVLVLMMVCIGGLTRLSESGLSIVQWKLVTGTLPPLSHAAWMQEFHDYQATPEFMKKNFSMNLEEFKQIFWLEYLHRLLGRIVGLWFVLPTLYVVLRTHATPLIKKRMVLMSALVCMQGAIGWYMVRSGLVDVPWVSPYRLALHLSMAALLWCVVIRTLLASHSAHKGWGVFAMMWGQLVLGALVAGLDAGYTYNSFPLMDGQWMPPHMMMLQPWYRNFFEHIPMVQFLHRWWAFVVLAGVFYQWLRDPHSRSARIVLAVLLVQVMLGIATLLSVVHIALASVHQIMACILLAVQLRHIYQPVQMNIPHSNHNNLTAKPHFV
ncbi:MAG: heme A synthase [Alphaproteobacteria bacterium]|nr:MAG: heme A synthase [Alphaproteobacteria bacterium]TAF16005.1 MAG: heme A synthase [Alphaproteobacteria bacterium]TAF76222.1 MAG: heme A synthase [Alphaproteobacteria bacterium]